MIIKKMESLELRITLITFFILFILLTIMTATGIINQNRISVSKSAENAKAFSEVIVTALRYPMMTGDQDVIQLQFDNYNKLKDIAVIHLLDDKGIIRRSTDRSLIGQKPGIDYLDELLSGKEHHGLERRRKTGKEIYSKADPIFNEPKCFGCHGRDKKVLGGIRIALDWNDEIKEANANKMRGILISFIGLLVIAVFNAIFFRRIVIRPIKALERHMQKVADGDLSQKIDIQSRDELGKLAGMFNRMTADLSGSMEKEKSLLAAQEQKNSELEKLNRILVREVVERKKTEEALRETKGYLENLFSYANAPIIVWNPDFLITRFNRAFEKLTGISAEEAMGKRLEILFPEESCETSMAMIKKTLGGERWEVAEIPIRHKSGEVRIVLWNSANVFGQDGHTIIATIAQGQDITERKKTEDALRDSEARFRAIFDNANDGIILVDTIKNSFYTGNHTICQMLGYSLEEFKKLWVKDIHPKEDLPYVVGQFERAARGEIAVVKDLPVKRKDGSVFYADVNTSLVILAGRTYLLGLFRDITERKRAEGALREAIKAKSDFTSTVSHELRTPLTAIKEGIAVVLDGSTGALNAEQKDFLSLAKRNVDRLTRLINDVLDFQKLEAQKMVFNTRESDINELIKEVYNTMAPLVDKKGLGFSLQLEEGLPRVKCDQDRIIQVLTNLVNNAIKFTDKGSIVITSSRGDNIIQVSVKDTGPGIKEGDMGSLFQQFSQLKESLERKTGGTGLGLAISKEIIEKHKGKIWVESEFGKGTTFLFVLPVKAKDNVLVIDDDKAMLDIIKNFLERKGYGVTCSEKGLDAVGIIGRDKPDLVILDMKLKDIGGFEIIGRLRSNKETSRIPIIAMSGYSEELNKIEDRQEELALITIAKPFDLENLLSIMRKLLQQIF